MRIAFVGGTRFIGRAAVEAALATGHDVVTIHRGEHPAPAALTAAGARDILADRTDPAALRAALSAHGPDVVVDTWAMTRTHAEILLAALDGVTGRVVVLSSQDVYAQFGMLNGLPAPPPEALVTEASPLTIPTPFRGLGGHPGGPNYDKKDVERVLATATGEVLDSSVALRLPAVYGRGDSTRRFGAIVDALDAGRPLPCQDDARWRWTHAHVRDVAHAILLAAEAKELGADLRIYNVGEASTPTMRERAESLAQAMGVAVRWEPTDGAPPDGFASLGRMPTDLVVSSAAIRADLGVHEVTTEPQRLADTIEWLRESR